MTTRCALNIMHEDNIWEKHRVFNWTVCVGLFNSGEHLGCTYTDPSAQGDSWRSAEVLILAEHQTALMGSTELAECWSQRWWTRLCVQTPAVPPSHGFQFSCAITSVRKWSLKQISAMLGSSLAQRWGWCNAAPPRRSLEKQPSYGKHGWVPLVAETKRRRARPGACVQTAPSGRAMCAGGGRLGWGDCEQTAPGRRACLPACALGAAARRAWARPGGHFAAVSIPPPAAAAGRPPLPGLPPGIAPARPRAPRPAPSPPPPANRRGGGGWARFPLFSHFGVLRAFGCGAAEGEDRPLPRHSPSPPPGSGMVWVGVRAARGGLGRPIGGRCLRRAGAGLAASGGRAPSPKSGPCERAEGPRRGTASRPADSVPRAAAWPCAAGWAPPSGTTAGAAAPPRRRPRHCDEPETRKLARRERRGRASCLGFCSAWAACCPDLSRWGLLRTCVCSRNAREGKKTLPVWEGP